MPWALPWSTIRCPYCSSRFHLADAPRRDVQSAQKEPDEYVGHFLDIRPPMMGVVFQPRLPCLRRLFPYFPPDVPDGRRRDLRRICPKDHMELPLAHAALESRTVAIIGPTGAGKSNYFGVLLYLLDHRFQEEVGFEMRSLDTFNLDDPDRPIDSGILYERRYNAYLKIGGDGDHLVLPKTQTVVTEQGSMIPLLYRIRFRSRRRAFDLAVFDTAGEDLTVPRVMEEHYYYLREAAGIVFLIDPEELPGLRGAVLGTGAEVKTASGRVISTVTNMLERHRRSSMPAAFVLTKLDLYRDLIYPGSPVLWEGRHESGFDAADFRQVSAEMQQYLARWGGAGIVALARSEFPDHGFFALTALGTTPSQTDRLPFIRPHRVADPLFWLFWRLGYIPTKNGTTGERLAP
jgi:Double-GTPase 2